MQITNAPGHSFLVWGARLAFAFWRGLPLITGFTASALALFRRFPSKVVRALLMEAMAVHIAVPIYFITFH